MLKVYTIKYFASVEGLMSWNPAIRPPCSCHKLVVMITLLMRPIATYNDWSQMDQILRVNYFLLDSLRCWVTLITVEIFFIGQGHRCQTTITIIIVGSTITTTVLVTTATTTTTTTTITIIIVGISITSTVLVTTATTTSIIIIIILSLSSLRKLRLGSFLNFL